MTHSLATAGAAIVSIRVSAQNRMMIFTLFGGLQRVTGSQVASGT